MRIRLIISWVLIAAAASPTVQAATDTEGSVLLPAPPAVARTAFTAGVGPNGLTGFVIDLGRTVKQGTRYELTRLTGGPLTDLDVWFYRDIDDMSTVCNAPQPSPDGDGGEEGRFTCDADWALVVLFTGINATFRFDW